MQRNSQRPSDDRSAEGSNCGNQRCRCCQASRRARQLAGWDMLPEWNSPLTPGVQLSNMSHSADWLALHVDLSGDWSRMLRQLTSVGSGLVMTRNEVAILGRRMNYPDLEWTSGRSKGADARGGLWVNCRTLAKARAMHTRRESGHVFGVEFRDDEDHIVHRFTLTPESNLDEFCGWVRLHQECAAHVVAPLEDNEGDLLHPASGADQVYGGGSELIESLFSLCLDKQLSVEVSVGTSAVKQRATFVPESLRPTDGWWFASSDEVGLHFSGEHFTQIAVEQNGLNHGPAVRCGTDAHPGALRVELGDLERADEWRRIVETIF